MMSKGAGFTHSQTMQYIEQTELPKEEKEKQIEEADKMLEVELKIEKAKEQRNKQAIEKTTIERSRLLQKQSIDRANRKANNKVKSEKKVIIRKPNWTVIFTTIIIFIFIGFFISMFRERQRLPSSFQQFPQQMVRMSGQVMRGGAKSMSNIIKKIKSLFK